MKKILLVATVQSHIAQFHKPLIKLLKDNGYVIDIAAKDNLMLKPNLSLENVNQIYNVPFERNPLSKNNFRSYKMMEKLISENNYDIIHCNTPVGGVITRIAVKYTKNTNKPKVFYTAHGFHFYEGSSLFNWLTYYPIEKYLSKYTSKLITITTEDYSLAHKKFNTDVYRMHGVGVDNEIFKKYDDETIRYIRENFGYKQNNFILLNVGELNTNKNQKEIILTINELKNIIPEIKLIIAGNGPKEDELKQLVDSLSLNKYVDFIGYKRGLEVYYNMADITISASLREGLPVNIIESLMCGTPCVVSNNRGHKELINNKNLGIIVNDNNYKDYSNAILRLHREGFNQNTSKYMSKYSIKNITNEIKNIYEI